MRKLVLILFLSLFFVSLVGAQELNYSVFCEVDNDCRLDVPSKLLECSLCDPYGCNNYDVSENLVVAVSLNWTPDCSWVEEPDDSWGCSDCIGGLIPGEEYAAKCVENECVKLAVDQVICEDLCGDGVCQDVVCLGEDCPCVESSENCQSDCFEPGEVIVDDEPNVESGEGGLSFWWIFVILVGIVFLVIIGLKLAKWLFWAAIIAAIIMVLLWIFVF